MALINCTECGKEVSDKAITCPNCGAPIKNNTVYVKRPNGQLAPTPKKKSNKGIIIAIVIGIIVLIGLFGGNSESETKSNDSKSNNLKAVEDKEVIEVNEEVENINVDKKEAKYTIGEIAEYNNVNITLLGYEESNGNDWGTPAEGNVFVYADFEIENNSDEEISISSMMSFENYCNDYKLDYSSNALMALSTEDNTNQLDGSISPGKKMRGTLGLEVPSDWKVIETYYKDNVWLDSNFSFIIEK